MERDDVWALPLKALPKDSKRILLIIFLSNIAIIAAVSFLAIMLTK